MTAEELINALNILAPPSYAMELDNPGLLVGDKTHKVDSVYLALDASGPVIEKAGACDMLITHHPMIFSAIKSVQADDFIGKRIIRLIKTDTVYFAMHTNFDCAVMGRIVSEKLGISSDQVLEEIEGAPPLTGIGCAGNLKEKMTLRDLAAFVRKSFCLPPVRYYGDPDLVISRAALCPGSGKSETGSALRSGAQVYITGDVDHHFGIDCVEKGIAVIDAGHHGLEHIFVDFMARWFEENYPDVRVVRDNNSSPFQTI